jgi:hypothetical protein
MRGLSPVLSLKFTHYPANVKWTIHAIRNNINAEDMSDMKPPKGKYSKDAILAILGPI